MIELGALWKKTSERTGNEYYTGDLKTPSGDIMKVLAFANDKKTKANHPDFRLYLQEGRPGDQAPAAQQQTYTKPAATYQRPEVQSRAPQPVRETPPPIPYPTDEIDPDDIPF